MSTYKNIVCLMLAVFSLTGFVACKKNDAGGGGVPVVTSVRLLSKTDTIPNVVHRVTRDSSSTYSDTRVVAFDSTVTSAHLSTQYAITGSNLQSTKTITLNGVSIYFNPTLVTDRTIIFTVPSTGVPFGPAQSNKLVVTTAHGSASFTLGVQQPPATIISFAPLAASAGDTITIVGTVFDGVTGVTFDKTPAKVIGTPTSTQIKVLVPAGVVQAYLYVTTPGGTAKSPASFGFKYVVYDDALAFGWGPNNGGGYDGYNSMRDYKSAAHPKRGAYAIAVTYQGAYGALQLGYGGAAIDVKALGLTAIKLSVYGDPATITAGTNAQVVINGDYGAAVKIAIVPGVYTDYTIPLSTLGSPAVISEIVVQGLGVPAPSIIYFDDIGFI